VALTSCLLVLLLPLLLLLLVPSSLLLLLLLLLPLCQGWLGRSDHVLHQGEGTIRAVNWHSSTLVWANEVGIKVSALWRHGLWGGVYGGNRYKIACEPAQDEVLD